MIFLQGSSKLKKEELLRLAEKESVLILNPKKLNSEQELLLAEKLAQSAIKENRNLAKKPEKEFLLWLAAKKDISSALSEYGFQTPKQMLLISFKKPKQQLIKQFHLKETKLKLRKKATPLEIERISLSRTI
jgi:tRNA threonylcarbamoyladenosine modification (KEOPS) complex Cgi121 subunit